MFFGCNRIVVFIEAWQRCLVPASDSMEAMPKYAFAIEEMVHNLPNTPCVRSMHRSRQAFRDASPETDDIGQLLLQNGQNLRLGHF